MLVILVLLATAAMLVVLAASPTGMGKGPLLTAGMHDAAVHQIIVVVDVQGFAARQRTFGDQLAIRDGLYRALRLAFMHSGVSWDACYHEDRGDGVLILVPGQVPKVSVAAGVPGALAAAVSAHNHAHGPGAQMRLRLALHAGEVAHDAHGVTGHAVTLAFRLLEARPLKQALVWSPGVLAVVASAWFYEQVIQQNETCAPARWRRAPLTVKETRQDGWISLPDAGWWIAPPSAHREVTAGAARTATWHRSQVRKWQGPKDSRAAGVLCWFRCSSSHQTQIPIPEIALERRSR
jgi:class 3 adenylate cyclase